MKYTGLELFMEKLKQMIYVNDNPLINNQPSILSERPQFQLLYEELGSLIQTLFYDEHHQLQKATELKKRFKDAAEEAHDIVDLFVYNINLGNKSSLNLEGVLRSIKSIKEDFMPMINDNKVDSSQITDHLETQSVTAGSSSTRNPLGTKKVSEEIVVGLDRHVELIRDKLAEDQKQLDVVSIVGMGGVGKTTLAKKIFNDPFVMYHFHVRGWVTVSQTYEKWGLLIQILESIGIKQGSEGDSYSRLREVLHKRLMGERYLILIDDIWSSDAWDDLKLFFPNNYTGSRLLLTSRHKEVALHAKSHGFIHQLEFLTKWESWELLCKKVFHGRNDCPKWLIEPGMKIASNCNGLPLTLVVIAGVLAKEATSKDSWERIGQRVSSYVVSGEEYVDQLALSFDHLPGQLRDCFLYLSGFPEDYKFRVERLIWLWMAEGFIQEDGNRNLEEIAEDCLMELVDRNLVVVVDRKSNGDIKAFYVHDVLRELCLKIATKENFFLKAQRTTHSVEAYKQRRLFIEDNISIRDCSRIRSLLCVYDLNGPREFISNWSHFWMLLMVLDLRHGEIDYFPEQISQLVHLRYLAISYNEYLLFFPSSICNLWSLQTLIIRSSRFLILVELPNAISNLVNLRHLMCEGGVTISFPAIQKPMILQTITKVKLGDRTASWVKCFPGIKKLSCTIERFMEWDFESLTSLENLKVSRGSFVLRNRNRIRFLVSLKSIKLGYCYLDWSDMSIFQSLPNLEVLKLLHKSFVGPRWDVGEDQFQQLKVLKLSHLEIKEWEASDVKFPCLKQLVVNGCVLLKEIPSDFGYIPTLELVSIYNCKYSVAESLDAIKEEQHAQGNFELKTNIKRVF